MSGRVLNFSEFSDKYNDAASELGVDDMSAAASNFEDGFDETTYDQPEIKPNRPVAGNYEMTPDTPGADSFSSFTANDMDAPEDETEETDIPAEVTIPEDTEEEEEPTDDETEGDTDSEPEEETEEEETEEGNPEAGANPKKKVEESRFVKDFTQFVNESYLMSEDDNTCPDCNQLYEETEDGGLSCGCKGQSDCGCDDTQSCGCNM